MEIEWEMVKFEVRRRSGFIGDHGLRLVSRRTREPSGCRVGETLLI